jgi:hypothetical protein
MTTKSVKHIVYGRPAARRTALDAVASRGLLTWWELMSDLDPGWLEWSSGLYEATGPRRRVA